MLETGITRTGSGTCPIIDHAFLFFVFSDGFWFGLDPGYISPGLFFLLRTLTTTIPRLLQQDVELLTHKHKGPL